MNKLHQHLSSYLLILGLFVIGCESQCNPTRTAEDPRLTVSISPENTCVNVGGSVEFNSTVANSQGNIIWSWQFGDSGNEHSADDDPTVTFDTKGLFEIDLMVEDGSGALAYASTTVRVKDDCSPPVASIDLPAGNVTVPLGQTVSFSGSATGGDLPYAYTWSFSPPGGGNATTFDEASTTASFETLGDWWVTFTVADNAMDSDTDEVYVTVVENQGGTAIDVPITGIDGLSVTAPNFAGQSGPLGWIMAYGLDGCVAIDFGTHAVVHTFMNSISFLSGIVLSPPPGTSRDTSREAIFGYNGSNTFVSYWSEPDETFGMVAFSSGGATDAVPYGNDPASGGLLYTRPGNVLAVDYDEAGWWLTSNFYTSLPNFPGLDGNLMSSFARDAGNFVVVTDGSPGQLYLAPRPAGMATLIGEVGDAPRQVRCLGELCVISCFGSDELWTATWDDLDNVSIVESATVGDGPIGIDLMELGDGNIAVVSTGFGDNSYSITVFTPAGEFVSNNTQPVPTECDSPPHAVWVPGDTMEILFTCNGSNNAFILPSGL